MASQVVSAEKRYRMSLLLDVYGELLTEKQCTFLRRYYEEDLSFGEIARESNISRQAVFDSVKHGEAALENYERVLKLVQNSPENNGKGIAVQSPELARCAARLRSLAEAVATSSVDSDVTWITSEMESIASDIERLGAGSASSQSANLEAEAASGSSPWNGPGRPSLLRSDGPEVD